eukprot:5186890-Pyramimonas_sp.AAC.2
MPGIAAPSIFEKIRTSCAEVRSPLVEIDEDAAARFGKDLNPEEVKEATKTVPGFRFPVRLVHPLRWYFDGSDAV